jgi:UDP-glucose:(heptosyl)LPS alpha-1,3-glucosyltransferase
VKFSFLIYSYFPYGGQQRDFLRIAQEILARGNEVDVYTLSWQGDIPAKLNVILVPVKAFSRISLYKRYTKWIETTLGSASRTCVVGFNKMPLLDVYFAADPCFLEKAENQRAAYYKYTGRYRHFKEYERLVFDDASQTEILLLSPQQQRAFRHYYPGCESRIHELPPGISKDRKVDRRDPKIGEHIRKEIGVSNETILILQIGSGFRVKGVDRSLEAIAALPPLLKKDIHYLLIGQDKSNRFVKLASRLGLTEQVTIFSGRDDVPEMLQAANIMLHPAYSESAGYVLLEATIAGLPILTTASCGYAFHIEKAKSGEVCPLPFQQKKLNEKLLNMLEALGSASWSSAGIEYGKNENLYTMPEAAADIIEANAKKIEERKVAMIEDKMVLQS